MDSQIQTSESFVITDKIRAIWQIEMEIASVLLEICQKYNLKIWASYGTLLGAVRHHGFIPWDDDMDFLMMREDFDKLFSLAKQGVLLPKPYELVIVDSAIIRLCNSNTTMLNAHSKLGRNQNHGIWVDILCLDIAPDSLNQDVIKIYNSLGLRVRRLNNVKNYCFNSYPGIRWCMSHLYCILSFAFQDTSMEIECLMKDFRKLADQFSGKRLWNVTQMVKAFPINKIKTYDASWFSETVMLPFGEVFLPCPKEYEKCLVAQYGINWRTPIMGTSAHEGAIIDVNIPYKDYINGRLSELKFWNRIWWTY